MNKFSVLLRKGYWCQGNLTFHIDIYVIVHCNEVLKFTLKTWNTLCLFLLNLDVTEMFLFILKEKVSV